MNETTFLIGAVITASSAALYFCLIFVLMDFFKIFKTFPIQALSESIFNSYSKADKLKSYLIFFIGVFIISLTFIYLMQGAKNPYATAFYGSLTVFFVFYPITFSLIFKKHFWFKELALFWFYIISHSIYWWTFIVYYVITLKWSQN